MILFWEGGFSAERLASRLGMRREHVQRTIILDYRARNPGALRREGYRYALPAEDVDPLLAPRDAAEVFNLLSAEDGIRTRSIAAGLPSPDHQTVRTEDVVALTTSRPDTRAFRALSMACAGRKSVTMSYLTRSGPAELKFSPHTLVRTAWRLHFRGHAAGESFGGNEGFGDFVPSRVLEIFSIENDFVADTEDQSWHAREDLLFRLSPDLPDEVRTQAYQEYMSDTITIPQVRLAIAGYVRRAMTWRVFRDEMYLTWLSGDAEGLRGD